MSSRSLLIAMFASAALLLAGAIVQDAVTVVGGLLSTIIAGVWLAIRLDDTTKPVNVLLSEDRLAADDGVVTITRHGPARR